MLTIVSMLLLRHTASHCLENVGRLKLLAMHATQRPIISGQFIDGVVAVWGPQSS